MAEPEQVKIIKKPEAIKLQLREATKQFVGQADRMNHLFVDIVLDLTERVEALEARDKVTI